MREQAGGLDAAPIGGTPLPVHPRRSALSRLLNALLMASVSSLAAGGVVLYQHVTRLEHDLGAATTELRSLRGEQARAERRLSGLTNDLDGLRTTVDPGG